MNNILKLLQNLGLKGAWVGHEQAWRNLIVGFEPLPRVPSGIARYTRELTRALEQLAEPELAIHRTHVREQLRPFAARMWAMGSRHSFGATVHVNSDERASTSFHATSVFAPRRGSSPIVVTVHDTVPFTHPQMLTRHGAAWHRKMIIQAVEHADALVVPTTAVAKSLLREFRHAGDEQHSTGRSLSERIHVAGGAASLELVDSGEAREIRQAFGLGAGRPYVVFVGTIEPRKGLEHLVRAVAQRKDLDLVIVGAPGWGKVDIRHAAIAARLDPDRLVVTGAVHDSTVASIVQGASALVLPSLAEGFGLPLIEAMRLGTPVVHSDDDALVEVAGGAGVVANILQFGYANTAEVVRELNRALDESIDRAEELTAAGLRRCADFSWNQTAARVASIHRQFTTQF